MFSLILPAWDVPDGRKVFKTTGTKPYILHDKIRIYGGEDKREITPDTGMRFLVGTEGRGDINCIHEVRPLRIEFNSPQEIVEFIDTHLTVHK